MPGLQSIEGLSSGLDITAMVNAVIESERYPITILEQDKGLKTQQVAAYKAVLAKFLALKTTASQLKKEISFKKGTVSVSDDSVLSATASGTVGPGSYSLRVLSTARNHQIAAQGFDDPTSGIFGTGTITLSVGDSSETTITVDASNNSLVDIKNAINDADAGVTAAVVNDGSSSNPYRLLLTADETGIKNRIDISVSLSDGETLDFSGTSFDNPEVLSFSDEATSAVSLAGTASYSGSVNKTYTFTVGGTGEQTVGTDVITVYWSDGTNEGAVLVTEADGEVELIGDGADGLKLSFSAGTLVAGDTFQVSTFAPLLQQASDARLAIGADGTAGGSPIIISSESNTFEDVIPGVTINAKKISAPGEMITINTDIDTEGIRGMLADFISRYNDVMEFIDEQFSYNQDTGESGVLFADFSLQTMQSTLRFSATSLVSGLTAGYNSLATIGIRSGSDGHLKIVDSSRLSAALENDLDAVIDLFIDSGSSPLSGIEFISASYDTNTASDFQVDITRAAAKGIFEGNA
ncbi:MAG: flagellar filament capping protein FliD, partial [Candidatus Zixiibacteriota bacterium]